MKEPRDKFHPDDFKKEISDFTSGIFFGIMIGIIIAILIL